ncbi:MAG: TetR/AcrR family transcriptional regulator [Ilumatobacteraceae bacterium]
MKGPRPPKRERTRAKLIEAGFQVLAQRGDALTASDVAQVADVANGTFYNHFLDRDDFIQTLANESLRAITVDSAEQTEGADPAWRFAVGSTRVLRAAVRQPLWGRAVLRLAEHPRPPHAAVQQHLREDLAAGLEAGRFAYGDDPVTVDIVTGTLIASLRRLIDEIDAIDDGAIRDVVARLLIAIGLDQDEAEALAAAADRAEQPEALVNPS